VDPSRTRFQDRQLRSIQFVTETARDCRIVAITFRSPIQPTRIEGPHLGIIYANSPGLMYWEPGGLHMALPEEHTIIPAPAHRARAIRGLARAGWQVLPVPLDGA
jgi:hypothetical protein